MYKRQDLVSVAFCTVAFLYVIPVKLIHRCVCVLIGKSLLWVAILGLIVFYIYALISFAILRSSFDPDNELYCATLWQCTITVIRYGLVGDLFDVSGL